MLPIQTLIRHEAAVHSVALQGDLLVSGSEDSDVKVSQGVSGSEDSDVKVSQGGVRVRGQ